MLTRVFSHCMLRPSDVSPLHEGTKVVGVFNPGVTQHKQTGYTYLVVRVVEQPLEESDTAYPSPRIVEGNLEIDWLDKSDVDLSDPRLYQMISTGLIRLRFISHLRVYRSKDGRTIDEEIATIVPESSYETFGIEDPRITEIDGTYYITYVAVSSHGACTSLLSTENFETYKRHGIILPPDNKDVVLFPEKINGQYVAMHRPMPSLRLARPEIWLAHSENLLKWGNHQYLLGAEDSIHRDRIGGGTPPIKTQDGWLTLYHGSDKKPEEKGVGRYTAGALTLDLNNPLKRKMQTHEPIMIPEEPYETKGFVDNVVFPTAIVERDDTYLVYYGAADENTAVTAFKKTDLHDALKPV